MPDNPDATAEPARIRTGDGTPIPDLSQAYCRRCGTVGSLRIEMRLVVKPFGEFSLAGEGVNTTATEWPWMVCDACGAESKGKPEPTAGPAAAVASDADAGDGC